MHFLVTKDFVTMMKFCIMPNKNHLCALNKSDTITFKSF